MTPTSTVIPIRPPFRPELLREAAERVEAFLGSRHHPRVLELGAGHSTPWLAGLCDLVMSVEHDSAWFSEVSRALHAAGLDADVWLEWPEHFPERVRACPDAHFDLVYVDCVDEQRVPCLHACLDKLRPDGLLVLDDSHWDMLQPAFVLLTDWHAESVEGMHVRHTGQVVFHKTTFFRRRA